MLFNIVGAGLAGSITARVLIQAGHEVRVFDNKGRFSASAASSNLYIRSWLKSFMNDGAAEGLEVLESLKLKTETPFTSGLAKVADIKHIPQAAILWNDVIYGDVIAVTEDGVSVKIFPSDRITTFSGPTILCVGYQYGRLLEDSPNKMETKVGHCLLFKGTLKHGGHLSLVRPYTHQKLYQFAPGLIYYADSVALKQQAYWIRQPELKEQTLARAIKLIGNLPIAEFRVGFRPIIKGVKFGELRELHPGRVWSINGGGKSGMVAYAYHAKKLVEAIG